MTTHKSSNRKTRDQASSRSRPKVSTEKSHAALKERLRALIAPGLWEGTIVKPSSITLGGSRHQGEPYAVEFSSCFLIAFAKPPGQATELPILVVLLTGQKRHYEFPASFIAGEDVLTFMLALHVGRTQFSDIIHFADNGRLGAFRFSLDRGSDTGEWQVPHWSIELKPSATWQQ